MGKSPERLIYRILAQTETITIAAQTNETTKEQAIEDAKKHVLNPKVVETGGYRPFVIQPVCSEYQWSHGNVNFCPRCGHRLEDIDDNYFSGECFECNAEIHVNITTYYDDD